MSGTAPHIARTVGAVVAAALGFVAGRLERAHSLEMLVFKRCLRAQAAVYPVRLAYHRSNKFRLEVFRLKP
jgi:hypothetical protein